MRVFHIVSDHAVFPVATIKKAFDTCIQTRKKPSIIIYGIFTKSFTIIPFKDQVSRVLLLEKLYVRN